MDGYNRLINFFHKYRNHQRLSDKCGLTTEYFWRVLGFYPGLIRSELTVTIITKNALTFEGFVSINTEDMLATKNSGTRYRILKTTITINQSNICSLIYIDTKKK